MLSTIGKTHYGNCIGIVGKLKSISFLSRRSCRSSHCAVRHRPWLEKGLVVYDLIRLLMLQAGIRHHVWPCRISFTEALLNWINNVLEIKASKTIGEREARIEPRAEKRRPTSTFPYLSAPRAQIKERLLAKRKVDQIMRRANVNAILMSG